MLQLSHKQQGALKMNNKFIRDVEGDLINLNHIIRVGTCRQGKSSLHNLIALLTNNTQVTLAVNFQNAEDGIEFFNNKLLGK
jgi:hypothetical protein